MTGIQYHNTETLKNNAVEDWKTARLDETTWEEEWARRGGGGLFNGNEEMENVNLQIES